MLQEALWPKEEAEVATLDVTSKNWVQNVTSTTKVQAQRRNRNVNI